MTKFFFVLIVTTVLSAAAAFAADSSAPAGHNDNWDPDQYSLVCESNGGYVECEAGMEVANVVLDKKLSRKACTFGGTWGYHGSRIWVNHGCKGKFSFEDANAPLPPPAPTPTPVPTPEPPKPIDYVDCRWNNMNWQPWYSVDMHFIGRMGYGFQDPNMCGHSVRLSRQIENQNAVCNWNGIGFTSYDIVTNAEVIPLSYQTIEACYAALR